jgi:hypothetical protein
MRSRGERPNLRTSRLITFRIEQVKRQRDRIERRIEESPAGVGIIRTVDRKQELALRG